MIAAVRVPEQIPATVTQGKELPINQLTELLRQECAMAGYTEILTWYERWAFQLRLGQRTSSISYRAPPSLSPCSLSSFHLVIGTAFLPPFPPPLKLLLPPPPPLRALLPPPSAQTLPPSTPYLRALCSKAENFDYLRNPDDGKTAVEIGNPATFEFEVCRSTLLASALKTLGANKDAALPVRLFEVGVRCGGEV